MVTGAGMPQVTAVAEAYRAAKERGIPVIADGGIKYSGEVTKAIAAGASSVMIGSLFAGVDESPGETILYQGRSFKSYRGMGSLTAMALGSSERYFQSQRRRRFFREASKMSSSANAPARTAWQSSSPRALKAAFPIVDRSKAWCCSWSAACAPAWATWAAAPSPNSRKTQSFVRITGAGLRESHVHDVIITREAPNYHVE
jgi:IMP dehydrogenase